jgi:hypothetical protein
MQNLAEESYNHANRSTGAGKTAEGTLKIESAALEERRKSLQTLVFPWNIPIHLIGHGKYFRRTQKCGRGIRANNEKEE